MARRWRVQARWRVPFGGPRLPPSIRMPHRWRRSGWPLVVVLVAVALGYPRCRRESSLPLDDRSRYHDQTFRVTRVVDGDTFHVDVPDAHLGRATTSVRLWGVDTPEIAHGGKPEMYFGPEATAYARRQLSGERVRLVLSPKKTRGKFGRLLAYVYLEDGGPMFNEMLLEDGYAYADFRFPHHYDRQFKSIEKRARRAAVGLWADISTKRMPPWRQRFEKRNAP